MMSKTSRKTWTTWAGGRRGGGTRRDGNDDGLCGKEWATMAATKLSPWTSGAVKPS